MAVVKNILKNTNNETVVKIAGTAGSATIDLSTDLVATSQTVSGPTQLVAIYAVQWAGLNDSTITISRGSVNILTLNGGNSGSLDFGNGCGFIDNLQANDDIVVTIAGAEAQCYLTLHKRGGYATKVETPVYGAYDDETQVGS